MMKRNYLVIFGLIYLSAFILFASSSWAESDNTRKMKAQAQHYFDRGEYYKAIDIWAEVLKIDSYDKEALQGLTRAQEIIDQERSEEKRAERKRLRELIQKGKNYYRDREYKQALSVWGEALSIDPTNKEVLDLIEQARIRAQYQIDILDKLDREKQLKTPRIGDLEKIANKMIDLLEKADAQAKKEKSQEFKKKAEEEIAGLTEEEQETKIAPTEEKIAAEDELKPKEEIGAKAEEKPEVQKKKFPIRRSLLIIGAIILLLIFIVTITSGTKIKLPLAKTPPKKPKKEADFQPRELKKFLQKKTQERDKDLFK